jgi:hypothetical protein
VRSDKEKAEREK